ncbi:cytidine deaminase (plasmid) [Deinococcus psychrotolerans]|uniref:Cytidine deaminase n=1 Tax=Deinococcus psychrotolerans TaxID=2489213 RepID=A0A3G8YHL6_9DEIO|nr:cytidine deaminase [Deinococcus psychrotolerans]AZI44762.1 cytidine deaminase [Deinococcus psychrotolerans]
MDSAALSAPDQTLIDYAKALIASLPENENHTVVAVARDMNGRLFEGLNLYHFTGGPCAEPVALAVAAAQQAGALELIVAAGNRGRGVLAPCGRCRQILFDYHPSIAVLVSDGQQVRRLSIRELLPYTYDWHAEQGG